MAPVKKKSRAGVRGVPSTHWCGYPAEPTLPNTPPAQQMLPGRSCGFGTYSQQYDDGVPYTPGVFECGFYMTTAADAAAGAPPQRAGEENFEATLMITADLARIRGSRRS